MHLASRILNHAIRNSEEFGTDIIKADPYDEKNLRLAALLHDTGHPPFSHGLEKLVFTKHEEYSSQLIEGPLAPLIEKAGCDPKEISNLVQGRAKKTYLAKILSSQLDADRMDYLTRDSRFTGVMYGVFDLERLILSLAVKNDQLVVLQKGLFAADQFLISRFYMYEQVYLHEAKRAFEGMASMFAKSANQLALGYPTAKEISSTEGIVKFLECDDEWFVRLLNVESKMDSARGRLAYQLAHRIPYKKVVDSEDLRKSYAKKEGRPMQESGLSGIDVIRKVVEENIDKLGLNSIDVLFDTYRNLPLELRPYTNPFHSKSGEEEAGSPIQIYDDETGDLTPIENTSTAIESLSEKIPRLSRIYAAQTVHEKLTQFVDKYKGS
jgi:HD superfamily phosphohydrolase